MGAETRTRLGLAALLAATLFSFELIFDGDAHAGPSMLGAAIAIAVIVGVRRLGAGPILSFEISLACLLWYLSVVFQADNTFYGLPTPATATGLSDLLSSSYDSAQVDVAPVPIRAGYVIMVVTGMWLAATIGEIATFRWRRPTLASLPCIVLIAVPLMLGTGAGSGFFLVVFLSALFTYWALESSHRLDTWGRWVKTWSARSQGGDPRALTGDLARRMGASCIALTLVAPLFLPSLGRAWLDLGAIGGGGSGDGNGSGGGNVDLLVAARPRPIRQSNEVLFGVKATSGSYWRLASLARFDGIKWRPAPTEVDSEGLSLALGDLGSSRPGSRLVEQIFTLDALEGSYLPAAVQPLQVDGSPDIELEAGTQALEIDGGAGEAGTYRVLSSVPQPTYLQLKNAQAGTGNFPGPHFVDLPQTSSAIQALANKWTEGATTPFDELIAIQNRLRRFDYSLDVESGASGDYLRQFLLETKEGFCQQFATAFAVLARVKGYPSRVSVGFLPGDARPLRTGGIRYTVRGTHAHAWPEVYFQHYGWIPFEPTPRSASSPPLYTTETSTGAGFGRAGEAPGFEPGPGFRAPEFRFDPGEQLGAGRRAGQGKEDRPIEEPPWRSAFGRLLLLLLGLAVSWVLGVPSIKRYLIAARYGKAKTPAAAVRAAWLHFETDGGALVGPRLPSESAVSYAHRLTRSSQIPERTALALAIMYEEAEYSSAGVTKPQAAESKRLAHHLHASLWSRATPLQKARALLSITPLLSAFRFPRGGVLRPASY
ncbi:MAG: DUF3488 and transglutaminase-like domain-containing protein [Actinomycetota bacterium]|nr:DUF3488 and transglutaminase-like domain-containing protein [Actinomycetota bacterium]